MLQLFYLSHECIDGVGVGGASGEQPDRSVPEKLKYSHLGPVVLFLKSSFPQHKSYESLRLPILFMMHYKNSTVEIE